MAWSREKNRRIRRSRSSTTARKTSRRLLAESLEDRRLLTTAFGLGLDTELDLDTEIVGDTHPAEPPIGFQPIADPFSPSGVSLEHALSRASNQPFVPGELVVAVDVSDRPAASLDWSSRLGVADVRTKESLIRHDLGDRSVELVELDLGQTSVYAAMVALANQADVLWSSPNFIYDSSIAQEFVPDDPDYSLQYHHGLIQSEAAWDVTLGDSSIVLAIPEDGVLLSHPDFSTNVYSNAGEIAGNGIDDDANGYIDDVSGWNFVDENADLSPSSNHGSWVTGVAAASTNNAVGIAGVASNATIMPLKFYDASQGFLWTSAVVAETMTYATDQGANIFSMSYNIDSFVGDPVFTAGLQYSYDQGVLHFNSAGNSNKANPARQAFTQTLLVANTTATDKRHVVSNYGTGIDISAPGTLVRTLSNGSGSLQYHNATGTSIAAPNAAGAAALIWSANPTWTREMVVAQLFATADNVDAENASHVGLLGAGRINVGSAVTQTISAPGLASVTGLPADGAIIPELSASSFVVAFDQVIDVATANDVANYDIRSAGSDGLFDTADDGLVALSIPAAYQLGTNDLMVDIVGALGPGEYRFSLVAGDTMGGLQNPFGDDFDGDADGMAGGNYESFFTIETPAIEAIGPDGGLIYQSTFSQSLNSGTESDRFVVSLDAGLTLSVKVVGDAALVPRVEILDSSSMVLADVTGATNEVIAQTVLAAADDDLQVVVTGDAGSVGGYTVELVIDAAIEEEGANTGLNDSLATAQTIESSSIALGTGAANRMAVVGTQLVGEDDWFAFSLDDGQLLSAVLDAGVGATVELYAADGTLLTAGVSIGEYAGAIHGFLDATTDGLSEDYFVRVADAPGDYALVLTRDSELDGEIAGELYFESQRLSNLTGPSVLGHVDDTPRMVADADLLMAGDEFDATFTHVAMTGSGGVPVYAVADASSGTQVFSVDSMNAVAWSDTTKLRADFTNPAQFASILVGADDLSDRGVLRAYDVNDVLLATATSDELNNVSGVAWQTLTISRPTADIAYVIAGGIDRDTVLLDDLEFGQPGGSDTYSIAIDVGDVFTATAFAPGDGPFDFVSALTAADLQLDLVDPLGIVVVSGATTISHTAIDPGVYELEVSVLSGAGEYFLETSGATPTAGSAFQVIHADLDGQQFTSLPTSLSIDFARAVSLASIDPANVTVNGVAATGYSIVDGDTITFDIDPLVDVGVGTYDIQVAVGTFGDLQGNLNDAFAGTFIIEEVGIEFRSTGIGGGHIARSLGNQGAVAADLAEHVFEFFVESDETIAAVVTPVTPGMTLHLSAVGISSVFTASAADESVILPATATGASGLFAISVGSDLLGDFTIDIIRNAVIHDGTATDLAASQVNLAMLDSQEQNRYAVVGHIVGDAMATDMNEFLLDMTGKVGEQVDIAVLGSDASLAGSTLELVAPDGMVEATAQSIAHYYDLALQGHELLQDGIYTVRLTSDVTTDYELVVTEDLVLGSNVPITGGSRSLDQTHGAIGIVGDQSETYLFSVVAGESYTVRTATEQTDMYHVTPNPVDPRLEVIDDLGVTVATDVDSVDGTNAEITWVAATTGAYEIVVGSEGAAGEYVLTWEQNIIVPTGDFDGDGIYDCNDIDSLVVEIAGGTHTVSFDLTSDGLVDSLDLDAWLLEAALANGFADAYLMGDINLNGVVDIADFNVWNANKFTSNASWCVGDINANGVIDIADFNAWNSHKFQSSTPSAPAAVVTPAVPQAAPATANPVDVYFALDADDAADDESQKQSRKSRPASDWIWL